MNDNTIYHYPPDLMRLLIDAVNYLNRSKEDVFLFFKGAGVPDSIIGTPYSQWKSDNKSLGKRDIARYILSKINEHGDLYLRQRREIIKRVIEFNAFSNCWEDDRLKAQGVIAEIQKVVKQKDAVTRIIDEVDKTRIEKIKQSEKESIQKAKFISNLEQIKNDLSSLFALTNTQQRGKKLELVLNNLFNIYGISIREAFHIVGDYSEGIVEQIDGVIEIDGDLYFVEMKWWAEPLGVAQISEHLVRVHHRSEVRAIIISASSYTEPAILVCKEANQNKVVVLCTLQEFVLLLEKRNDLREFLKKKINAALIEKNPFIEVC